MSEPTKIKWRISGEEVVSCNCNWGCPCQFNALPTTGQCEAIGTFQINDKLTFELKNTYAQLNEFDWSN